MSTTVRYTFLEDDLIAFNQYHLTHSPAAKNQKRSMMFGFAVLILPVSVLLGQLPEEPVPFGTSLLYGVVGIALMCGYVQYAYNRNVSRQISKLLKEGSTDGLFGPQELIVDELGVRRRNKLRESFAAWPVVRKVEESPDHVLIYVSAIEAHVIPKKRIVDGTADELLAELHSHMQGNWMD